MMAVGPSTLPDFHPVPGVRLGVVEAGVRYAKRKDLVLIELAPGGTWGGVFTKNVFCAPPVRICRDKLARAQDASRPSYLLINTGNANAGTGPQGFADAHACCEALARHADVAPEQVLPFSTGVIGEKLPVERIVAALPAALASLDTGNWAAAASGIMTTDTRPKGVSRQLTIDGKVVTINGISKGAGMIKPNMATMLCYVATDAAIPQALIATLVRELADQSFNRITIDGDTSTNDSCMLLASGQSGVVLEPPHPRFAAFKSLLKEVFVELAQLIVRDGEGATKFVTVQVEGARNSEEALGVAYTIAHSPLIKTALFASDPNWGRILAALGRAPVPELDLDQVNIWLGEAQIVAAGGRCPDYTEAAGQAVMKREEITIRVSLNRGGVCETVWTCDLSHDYVTINADYRS
jgi:glutamate N-acetyltransferase/amino-acid N-acetyltransferase